MHTLFEALLASVLCLVAWILYCVAIVARRRTIIKRQFPGPPTTSFLLGAPLPHSVRLLTSREQPLYTASLTSWRQEHVLEQEVACVSESRARCVRMQATLPRPTSLIVTR